MNDLTRARLELWTKAREARDCAQRRTCTAASLFVKGQVSLAELTEYVRRSDDAERSTDERERSYRESYAPKGGA